MMLSEITVAGLLLASTHFGPQMYDGVSRTSWTPGLYVVHKSGLTVGAYRNSMRLMSYQVGYTHDFGRWSLSGGLVNYEKNYKNRVIPYVAVSYAFGARTGARVIAMPEETLPVAMALEFRR